MSITYPGNSQYLSTHDLDDDVAVTIADVRLEVVRRSVPKESARKTS